MRERIFFMKIFCLVLFNFKILCEIGTFFILTPTLQDPVEAGRLRQLHRHIAETFHEENPCFHF